MQFIRLCLDQVLCRKNGRLELAIGGSLLLHLLVLVLLSPMGGGLSAGAPHLDSKILNAVLVPASSTSQRMSEADEKAGESVMPELVLRRQEIVEVRPDESGRTGQATPEPVAPRVADAPSPPQPATTRDTPGHRGGVGLGKQPRLLSDISLDYPASAGDREGRVTLRIVVSTAGSVDDIVVINSDPPGVFDSAAINAFSSARFAPGEMLGVPVKAAIVVEVDFLPTSRGNVSGRGY